MEIRTIKRLAVGTVYKITFLGFLLLGLRLVGTLRYSLGIGLLSIFLVSGCTTLSSDVNLVTDPDSDVATILVYREGAFQAGGVSLYVGTNDKYFLKLRNNQYAVVDIDAGEYVFQANADGAPASELTVILTESEKVCLSGKPNRSMGPAVIVPLVANMVPTFILEEVDCPSEDALSEYVRVDF